MRTRDMIRCVCALFVVIGLAVSAQAQEERGWGFSGRLQGSSNSSRLVLKADPSLDYTFNQYFRTYVGLPAYFVNPSSTTSTATTTASSNGFIDGLGNAYVGVRFGAESPAVNYVSNLVLTAPTGDKDKGFSTGRATVDWTNSFSRQFSPVTPFGSFGVANTVSDTSFFVRPFSSAGFVSHFDGGATFGLSQSVEAGALAYAVKAAGQQRIISKRGLGKNRVLGASTETVGPADIANDHGFSAWLGLRPKSTVDFQIGYTRSVNYSLDTLFFGVGFRLGK
jgi:hypothetical protein